MNKKWIKLKSMGKLIVLMLPMLLLMPFLVAAEPTGLEVFDRLDCYKCHASDHQKMGPALEKIAAAYGDKAKLLGFLNGKTDAIVSPEMAGSMIKQRKKIKTLSDAERNVLADYIMAQKK